MAKAALAIRLPVAACLAAASFSCAAATTITATNCSQPTVQSAVNMASDGDTVIVRAGTCTWPAAVVISGKTITLRGAGSGSGGTKIIHGGGDHALISVDAGTKTGRMDISGFWFFGKGDNTSNGTAMRLHGPVGWKNLRVHHNMFEGGYWWTIKAGAATYGLIDNNVFKGSAHGILFSGRGEKDWSTPLKLGTADFFFVESNIFDWDDWYGVVGAVTADMENGGRQVFRYNTVRNGFWGTHDRVRGGFPSANAFEIYRNTFVTQSEKWKGLDISAGTGVAWGNTFDGDWMVPIGAIDYKTAQPRQLRPCDGTDPADQNVPGQSGWRCQYQIGSMGEGPSAYGYPLYLWNNRHNGSLIGMICTAGCSHLRAGRDFINNGTVAKAGYTPFVFPHPLRNPQGAILTAPKNVRVSRR